MSRNSQLNKFFITLLMEHFLKETHQEIDEESELRKLNRIWVEQNGGYESIIEQLRIYRNNLPTEKI